MRSGAIPAAGLHGYAVALRGVSIIAILSSMLENASPTAQGLPAQAPAQRRIYAIGDIHGRDDLLRALHRQIQADVATAAPGVRPVVVYLGDYVDRGPGSLEVIDLLLNEPLKGFERVHLIGNHERMMLDFLEGPPDPVWLFNGGTATLLSYGVAGLSLSTEHELEHLRCGLAEALPSTHRGFLESLSLSHEEGDYLFVHAGVRPGRSLDLQEAQDMLWIRGPFLHSTADFGRRIVHGHTITPEPFVARNRIGIDTGAFFSGRLTCAVLEGADVRFLHT